MSSVAGCTKVISGINRAVQSNAHRVGREAVGKVIEDQARRRGWAAACHRLVAALPYPRGGQAAKVLGHTVGKVPVDDMAVVMEFASKLSTAGQFGVMYDAGENVGCRLVIDATRSAGIVEGPRNR